MQQSVMKDVTLKPKSTVSGTLRLNCLYVNAINWLIMMNDAPQIRKSTIRYTSRLILYYN